MLGATLSLCDLGLAVFALVAVSILSSMGLPRCLTIVVLDWSSLFL